MTERRYYCYSSGGGLLWARELSKAKERLAYYGKRPVKKHRDYWKEQADEAREAIARAEKNLVYDLTPIVYREKSFLTPSLSLDTLYLYEEGGVVYEFFTGREYGQIRGMTIESEYVSISLSSAWSNTDYARSVTAAEFADRVEEHVKAARLVKPAVSRKLDEILAARKRDREEAALEKERQAAAEREAKSREDWLASYIDASKAASHSRK